MGAEQNIELEELKTRIRNMSPDTKAQLAAFFAYENVKDVLPTGADDVLRALFRVLRTERSIPAFTKTMKGKNKVIYPCNFVLDYISDSSTLILTRNHRRAMLRVLFRCLIAVLSPKIPRTPESVLRQVHQLPSAVEQAFPGYAEARLLHKIVPLEQAWEGR